jgi:hypothetical protein
LKHTAGTAADGADANPPPQSGPEKTGAPAAAGLSKRQIQNFADWYVDQAADDIREGGGIELDRGKLDASLREALRERCLPEHVETEFTRIMDAVFRV